MGRDGKTTGVPGYYRMTAAGRRKLRDETATWLRYTKSVTAILSDRSSRGLIRA